MAGGRRLAIELPFATWAAAVGGKFGAVRFGVSSFSHSGLPVFDQSQVRSGEPVKVLCGRTPHHAIDPASVIARTRCTADSNATVPRSRFSRLVFWLGKFGWRGGRLAT